MNIEQMMECAIDIVENEKSRKTKMVELAKYALKKLEDEKRCPVCKKKIVGKGQKIQIGKILFDPESGKQFTTTGSKMILCSEECIEAFSIINIGFGN